jgi:hypothetical protein
VTATNRWLFISESRGDSNRCTPCRGKPAQHDMYASHRSPRTPDVRFLRAVYVRGNLSWVINRVGQSHCSREKGLPTQSTTYRLTDPRVHTQFCSRANQWRSGESQTSINSRLLGLSGPCHQHAIGTFNTCLRGPTHRSVTDTGGGYNLGGVGLPHTTPWPSEPTVFTFHLRAPPGLQFNQVPTTKPKCWVWRTYGRHVVFRPLGHLP